uniref:Uncharacterized protein n=1 Tax=Arundo donax TaxID=35708 RepID=A0A0A9BI02_ARUDO
MRMSFEADIINPKATSGMPISNNEQEKCIFFRRKAAMKEKKLPQKRSWY